MLIFMESKQPQLQGKQNQSKSMIGSHPVFPDKFSPKKENTHPSQLVGVQTYFRYPSDINIIRWNLTFLVAKGNNSPSKNNKLSFFWRLSIF